jgi:hypothetical protein
MLILTVAGHESLRNLTGIIQSDVSIVEVMYEPMSSYGPE